MLAPHPTENLNPCNRRVCLALIFGVPVVFGVSSSAAVVHQLSGCLDSPGSLLHARGVVWVRTGSNGHKNHLRLALACEGGGLGANRVEKEEKPPPACTCMRGRWWWGERGQNTIKPTSGSLLHAREVVAG